MSAEQNLANLGIILPPPPAKGGVYTPVVVTGNLAYVSGHISLELDGSEKWGETSPPMRPKKPLAKRVI